MTCAVGSARPTVDGRVTQESRGEQEPERKSSEMVGHCLSDRWRDIAPERRTPWDSTTIATTAGCPPRDGPGTRSGAGTDVPVHGAFRSEEELET